MDDEFFQDFQINKKDFKEDTAKCKELNEKLKKEKFDLEEYRNKELVYSSDLSEVQNILNKFALIEIGKEFVKAKEYDKAVIYFESLLDNSYFKNDYHIYRQLAINYVRTKPKQFDKQLEIVKKFFKSGIYCSHNQYLWFSKKLFELRDKKLITTDEINECSKYFMENGKLNKSNENSPVALAERLFKNHKGEVNIDNQYAYERKQIRQEMEYIGQEYKMNKDYENVIGFYKDVFEYTNFDSIKMYETLIFAYEKLGDYESVLETLALLFKKNYIRGETNRNKFNKKMNLTNKKLGTSYTPEDLRQLDFNSIKNRELPSINHKSYPVNDNVTDKKIIKNRSGIETITVASNNLRKLLKSDVGDEIIVKLINGHGSSKLQITEIKNKTTRGHPENNIIKLSEENFNYIQNLNIGDLIRIKCKGRRGSAILKVLGETEVSDIHFVTIDNIKFTKSINELTPPTVKYKYAYHLPEDDTCDLKNPFEYDNDLSVEENIQRKCILKYTGLKLKKSGEAVDFFERMKKNSYFENDWYPYRQLAMIYNDTHKYQNAINNIKDVFFSGVYLNEYQYVWFINKLNIALNYVSIDKEEIEAWKNFYNENGANNKEKLDVPIFIADRIIKKEDWIKIYSEEQFYNDYQILSEFEEKIKYAENVNDYNAVLDLIKSYYEVYYSNISHEKTMRFRKKLKTVNEKLGTEYRYTDFI